MASGIRRWLLERANKDRENLRLFVIGAFVFFTGLAVVVLADRMMLPSLKQEILVLCGLFVTGVGGILAAMGYIALGILRIIRLTSRDD
ncbi:MAG: hypothetical protein KYX62_15860 [Pseudomonadota bacterium]|nr:hypothetical protein [Pseudomonadota bacterium]